MKKYFVLLCMVLVTALAKATDLPLIDKSAFATTLGGKEISLYTLRGGDIVMQVTNYGGRVVALWTPDREGNMEDVVLGYNNIDSYINNRGERFLGACIGVVANRIAGGKFTLDGKEYQVPLTDGVNTLHGGNTGIDKVVWDVVNVTDNSIVLHYLAADGEEGFPGNRDITMTYTLTEENEFKIEYKATTDAPALVNLSNHSFFNLKGEGNGTILDHELTINADHITRTSQNLIPTGELMAVEGTPFDFRTPHIIGERINSDHEQMRFGSGYDANWCINQEREGEITWAATLYEPTSGRVMEVLTDQPGMQFYSGNFFGGWVKGKYGRTHKARESLALETQKYPDAINQEGFPSIILNLGEEYTHTCIYKFSAK